MSDKDSPRSRPLDEIEPGARPEQSAPDPGAPGLSPHSLPIEATRPAADAGLAGPGDPALPRRRVWGRRLLAAGIGLAVTGATAALVETVVTDALVERDWSSWVIAGGLALAVAGVLVGLIREWLALESLDGLREARLAAESAEDDPAAAAKVVERLRRLYRNRTDLEWAWARVDGERHDTADGAALLHLVDRLVLTPLDRRAELVATAAIRRGATIAAISPFALLDMAMSLIVVGTMLRRMLRLYGGRPGLLATWRLLRMSIAYILASGALEFADDTIGDALGVGLASRLSRRVGTGLMNGLLTARIAAAAMTLIRPFPPHRNLPSARALLGRAVVDLRGRDE